MKEKVLIVEAHSDDSAISIGGFLEKFRSLYEYHFVLVCASDVVFHHSGLVTRDQRIEEYRNYVNHFDGTLHTTELLPFDSESALDTIPRRLVVAALEKIIAEVKPSTLIFQGPSFHHDHTVVYEATVAATRPTSLFLPSRMLVMENPTYVHSLGPSTDFQANYFVELSEIELEKKLSNYRLLFPTQIRSTGNYLSEEGLKTWSRYRGVEARSQFAEGLRLFHEKV